MYVKYELTSWTRKKYSRYLKREYFLSIQNCIHRSMLIIKYTIELLVKLFPAWSQMNKKIIITEISKQETKHYWYVLLFFCGLLIHLIKFTCKYFCTGRRQHVQDKSFQCPWEVVLTRNAVYCMLLTTLAHKQWCQQRKLHATPVLIKP